jgi:hypothetical protein
MPTQQRMAVVVRGFVAITYGFRQAPVSLTAPTTESGVQHLVSAIANWSGSPPNRGRLLVYSAWVSPGRPQTIGEVRASGHKRETVKQEMRRNLLTRLRSGEPLLEGIVGYDDTVLPQLSNAVISGHDVILLGERGQAKSRIMR